MPAIHLIDSIYMFQWLKKKARLVFNSSAVQLQEDLHVTLNATVAALRYEARRNQLIDSILHKTESGITTDKYTNHDIIVSLTSYGKRIHEVALTIESIMQQTMKPNRIVLWLDDSYNGRPLPIALSLQQRRGLEIAFCPDIRSYTKLIPQLRQTPKDAIITVDDDVLYDYDVLEHLIQSHLEEPRTIHCCRVHRIKLDSMGRILPYAQWDARCGETGINPLYFITGVGGVLYPPDSLAPEVFDQETFLALCPEADDIWFTAMAIKKGTPLNKVSTRNPRGEDYVDNHLAGTDRLAFKNVTQKGNDRQFRAVFSKYSLFGEFTD